MTLSNIVRKTWPGVALATLLASSAQAAAPQLLSAKPGEQNGWRAYPDQLRLTFNGPVAPADLDIQMMDPDGRRIRLGKPMTAGDTVTVTPARPAGPPISGPYMVTWRAKTQSGEGGEGAYSVFVQ